MPNKALYQDAKVEMVILPGGDGQFGVMPSHVPTITEVKPGVVSVQDAVGGPLTKYFVAGGFASGTRPESALGLRDMVLACGLCGFDPPARRPGSKQRRGATARAGSVLQAFPSVSFECIHRHTTTDTHLPHLQPHAVSNS